MARAKVLIFNARDFPSAVVFHDTFLGACHDGDEDLVSAMLRGDVDVNVKSEVRRRTHVERLRIARRKTTVEVHTPTRCFF